MHTHPQTHTHTDREMTHTNSTTQIHDSYTYIYIYIYIYIYKAILSVKLLNMFIHLLRIKPSNSSSSYFYSSFSLLFIPCVLPLTTCFFFLPNRFTGQNTLTVFPQSCNHPPHNEGSGYDTKHYECEVSIMLELWRLKCTPSTASFKIHSGPEW